jgi:hypothetical protein
MFKLEPVTDEQVFYEKFSFGMSHLHMYALQISMTRFWFSNSHDNYH